MASPKTDITFPPGRLVQGSLYKGRTTDSKGVPLVYKSGDRKGQPQTQYYFAVAIAKEPGHTHWSQTAWGQQVLQVGAAGYPQGYQHPTFSWKIEDGDSRVPNKNGKIPAEQEGFSGHWVVKFASTAQPPRIFQRDASGRPVDLVTPDAVKLGYFVQVGGNVSDNKPSESPGVYVNYSGVLFLSVGAEIYSGPDANAMFGTTAGPLPAGALATPLGVAALPATGTPGVPAAPLVVQPHAGFLAAPVLGAAVAPALAAPALGAALPVPPVVPVPGVPAAPAAPVKQMTAKAIGATYEAFVGQGWTDAMLIQQGYMLP